MTKQIAIIGAGVSGLAAAWKLRGAGVGMTAFEKSRGVSGRAASRTRHGVRFDHGANYFKLDSESVSQLVRTKLPTDDLVRIDGDVWTFDRHGQLTPGDPELNAEPKWTYSSGISTLGKLLTAESDIDIVHQVRVGALAQSGDRWQLHSDAGAELGKFDGVLITAPSPQAIELLEASQLDGSLRGNLLAALEPAGFHRQFSVILGIDGVIERPGDFFALVNTDRGHDVAWLSFENDKPGRVPAEQTVLIVQLSPDWTARHFDTDFDAVTAFATERASTLLGCDLPVAWSDIQRWKFAHPCSKAAVDSLGTANAAGLFFAGDGLVGKGRVPQAIETGFDAADRICEQFGL